MVLWPGWQGLDALDKVAKVDPHSENGTLDGHLSRTLPLTLWDTNSLEH